MSLRELWVPEASLTFPDTYPSDLPVRGLRHEFFTLMLGRSRGSSGRLPFLTPFVSYSEDIYASRASFPSPLHHCWVRLFVSSLEPTGAGYCVLHSGLICSLPLIRYLRSLSLTDQLPDILHSSRLAAAAIPVSCAFQLCGFLFGILFDR